MKVNENELKTNQPFPSTVVIDVLSLFGVVLVHKDPKGPPPRCVPL